MAKAAKVVDETKSDKTTSEQQVKLVVMHLNGIDADVQPSEVERWKLEGWQAK